MVLVNRSRLICRRVSSDASKLSNSATSVERRAAETEADGVETWDLTGAPSAEAFGIADGSRAGIYETDEPRDVVLVLAGDERLEVEAKVLSFERARSGGGSGERFNLGLRGPTVPAGELVDQLRGIVEQLDVEADVDAYAAELADAPDDQPERIRFSSSRARFGDLELGVQANLAPIAQSGRFILGGAWR